MSNVLQLFSIYPLEKAWVTLDTILHNLAREPPHETHIAVLIINAYISILTLFQLYFNPPAHSDVMLDMEALCLTKELAAREPALEVLVLGVDQASYSSPDVLKFRGRRILLLIY